MRAETRAKEGPAARTRLAVAGLMVGMASLSVAVLPAPVAGAATFSVTNCNDSGPGSLRAEVAAATSGSTVTFAPAVSSCSPIVLTSSTITISRNIAIEGPGSSLVAVSGGSDLQVFAVPAGVTADISGLTIEDGIANKGCIENCNSSGGGIQNGGNLTVTFTTLMSNVANMGCDENCGSSGGGIGNTGTLTVNNSTVYGNSAVAGCTYNCSPSGGGIQNSGTMTVSDSTVEENFTNSGCDDSCGSFGGGIDNAGTATVTADTLAYNQANGSCTGPCGSDGGGIYNTGALTVVNSTLYSNTADSYCDYNCGASGGGIDNTTTLTLTSSTLVSNSVYFGCPFSCGASGGDLYNSGTADVGATILAGSSTVGGDCAGSITDENFNIADDPTCSFTRAASTNDSVTLDTYLGPLTNNGGPTPTIELLPGSPAIDQVTNASQCPTTDQRGVPRTVPCDIGAYDTDYAPFSFVCTTSFQYDIAASTSAGNFFGVFCFNGAGTGTYTQYSEPSLTPTATGTGTVNLTGTSVTLSASGTKLSLLAQGSVTSGTFTETAPAPMKTGTYVLS